MIIHGYMEVVMLKSLIAGLVGLGLLASQSYATVIPPKNGCVEN